MIVELNSLVATTTFFSSDLQSTCFFPKVICNNLTHVPNGFVIYLLCIAVSLSLYLPYGLSNHLIIHCGEVDGCATFTPNTIRIVGIALLSVFTKF